jgi:hypothetical protein
MKYYYLLKSMMGNIEGGKREGGCDRTWDKERIVFNELNPL